MSCAYTTGENKFRRTVTRRHNLTLNIKGLREGFRNGARIIDKFLLNRNSVGLIKSVLLKVVVLVGQKENTTIRIPFNAVKQAIGIRDRLKPSFVEISTLATDTVLELGKKQNKDFCPFLSGGVGAYRCTCLARHRCLKGNLVGALIISPACFSMKVRS
jgi:hypothetical protein